MDYILDLLCVIECIMGSHLRATNEIQILDLDAFDRMSYFHHFSVNEMANFWRRIFVTDSMFIRSHSCFTLHSLRIILHEEKSIIFGDIANPSSNSIICSLWITLGCKGVASFSGLFCDFEHMGEVAYPRRLIVSTYNTSYTTMNCSPNLTT